MSVLEAVMMICFGAAWPVSLYKSWISRSCEGKSLFFLYIVLVGYTAGITHKLLYSRDWVIVLYVVNFLMVLMDVFIYYHNLRLQKKTVSRS
jgi:hypothetical protein